PADIAAFQGLGRGLTDCRGLKPVEPVFQPVSEQGPVTGILVLEAEGPWRIGQGTPDPDQSSKPADFLPKTEECVCWNEQGEGERRLRQFLLPAASLKGAIRHRMAFYARCLGAEWVVSDAPLDQEHAAVEALFGSLKHTGRENEGESGRAGALFFDDVWVDVDKSAVLRQMHNVIDRFTGGVMQGKLFEEESLTGGQLRIPVVLDTRRVDEGDEKLWQALALALADLCEGRLALGSRITTGNGYFRGRLEGELAQWLQERGQPVGEVA
ncbi:MAG: hypothetical protein D6751_03280, partial [Deltaproteobacteria bacterium]